MQCALVAVNEVPAEFDFPAPERMRVPIVVERFGAPFHQFIEVTVRMSAPRGTA